MCKMRWDEVRFERVCAFGGCSDHSHLAPSGFGSLSLSPLPSYISLNVACRGVAGGGKKVGRDTGGRRLADRVYVIGENIWSALKYTHGHMWACVSGGVSCRRWSLKNTDRCGWPEFVPLKWSMVQVWFGQWMISWQLCSQYYRCSLILLEEMQWPTLSL